MEQKTQNAIISLRDHIILYAKNFLEEAGEFYPFGSTIDNKDALSSTAVYFNEEHPDSISVIKHLNNGFDAGFKKGNYKFAAMGIDVYLSNREEGTKTSAIEINIFNPDKLIAKFRLPYILGENNKFHPGELITVSA